MDHLKNHQVISLNVSGIKRRKKMMKIMYLQGNREVCLLIIDPKGRGVKIILVKLRPNRGNLNIMLGLKRRGRRC